MLSSLLPCPQPFLWASCGGNLMEKCSRMSAASSCPLVLLCLGLSGLLNIGPHFQESIKISATFLLPTFLVVILSFHALWKIKRFHCSVSLQRGTSTFLELVHLVLWQPQFSDLWKIIMLEILELFLIIKVGVICVCVCVWLPTSWEEVESSEIRRGGDFLLIVKMYRVYSEYWGKGTFEGISLIALCLSCPILDFLVCFKYLI